jgi:glyoxylase-like metal-dependent hydrolase (beta-lactamase superfamily II)
MVNPPRRFKVYDTGFCTHPGCMVERGAGLEQMRFPALALLFEMKDGRYWLFDTGYADHFHQATQRMPEKLYALATPVRSFSLVEKLRADGIEPQDISAIVISHFHADHIAGLKDFPEASLICDYHGLKSLKDSSRIKQVLKGFLQDLFPEDCRFHWRGPWTTTLSSVLDVRLEHDLQACDIADMGGYLVSLPGHAVGHMGFLFRQNKTWVLLCADAYWTEGNLKDLLPNKLTHLIMDNAQQYRATIYSLQELKTKLGDGIVLIGSHESNVYEKLKGLGADYV